MTIHVHCDGSSTGRSNREGGWAYIIERDGQPLHVGYGGHPSTTNNLMELEAAIQGLKALALVIYQYPTEKVVLISDSRYCLGMASGKLAANKNLEKVNELRQLYRQLCNETKWVRGHNGDPYNEKVDRFAKLGKAETLEKSLP